MIAMLVSGAAIALVCVCVGFWMGRRTILPAHEPVIMSHSPGDVREFEDPYRDAMRVDEDDQ